MHKILSKKYVLMRTGFCRARKFRSHCIKNEVFHKDFFSKYDQINSNWSHPYGKLHFLCSVGCKILILTLAGYHFLLPFSISLSLSTFLKQQTSSFFEYAHTAFEIFLEFKLFGYIH